MLIEDFLVELRRLQQQVSWTLRPDVGPHRERRAKPRYKLRGSAREGPAEGITLDPIGAVCYALNGRLYEPEYWREAAAAITLPLVDAEMLRAAADDRTWKDVEGRRLPDSGLVSLRTRLIEAVGLAQST